MDGSACETVRDIVVLLRPPLLWCRKVASEWAEWPHTTIQSLRVRSLRSDESTTPPGNASPRANSLARHQPRPYRVFFRVLPYGDSESSRMWRTVFASSETGFVRPYRRTARRQNHDCESREYSSSYEWQQVLDHWHRPQFSSRQLVVSCSHAAGLGLLRRQYRCADRLDSSLRQSSSSH
jgi:hypothetical protein